MQNAADSAGSELGVTAKVQQLPREQLQDDICSIQKAMGSAEVETHWVKMDSNTEVQHLQEFNCGEPAR